MSVLVVASDNPGKLKELGVLLDGLPYDIEPQSRFGLSTPEETGTTFAENALLKARYVFDATGHAALADDSGLIVDALGGEPGIFSARYAGAHTNAEDAALANINKLLARLEGTPDEQRTARFFCALACLLPDVAEPIEVSATWEGRITSAPQGDNGFGYDPVFFVPSHNCTSAELPPETKHELSHRGQALRTLRTRLESIQQAKAM